jgi:hypothetical protein
MGKSTNLGGNPDLAQAHEVGAAVSVIQTLVHSIYGTMHYPLIRLWRLHLQMAVEAATDLEQLHRKVLEIPVADSNSRMVANEDLLLEVYSAGTKMVGNAIRAIQHLSQEIEHDFGMNNVSQNASERIKASARRLGLPTITEMSGYDGLAEMVSIRNAIEHPQATNVHQDDERQWDEVPLAWMLSDRGLLAFARFREWFETLVSDIDTVRATIPQRTVQLTVVRGIESKNSAKKSPAFKR